MRIRPADFVKRRVNRCLYCCVRPRGTSTQTSTSTTVRYNREYELHDSSIKSRALYTHRGPSTRKCYRGVQTRSVYGRRALCYKLFGRCYVLLERNRDRSRVRAYAPEGDPQFCRPPVRRGQTKTRYSFVAAKRLNSTH